MEAPGTDLKLASDILRGDLASLPPPLALALAARAVLRLEPFSVGLMSNAEGGSYAQHRALHSAALAAFVAAFKGPLPPGLTRLVASELGVPDPAIESWSNPDRPIPNVAAVACAAAAAANPQDLIDWVARTVIAAVGGGVDPRATVRGAPPEPLDLADEAATDFSAALELGGNGDPMPVLARRLWREDKQTIEAYRVWSGYVRGIGLADAVEDYDRFRAGEPPPVEEALARLNDWLNGQDPRLPEAQKAESSLAAETKATDGPATVEQAQVAHAASPRDSDNSKPGGSPPAPEQRVPLAMFSDEPLTDERADVLDFRPYADALAGLITNPSTATPLTLAINAPWGAGKSTLAKMVRQRLENTIEDRSGRPHVTCWFDSWAHDDADDLSGAFVATVAQAAAAARPRWRRLVFWVPRALLTPSRRTTRHALLAIPALLAIVGVAVAAVSLGLVSTALLPKEAQLPPLGGALVLMGLVALVLLGWVTKAASAVGDFIRDPKRVAATGAVTAVRDQLRRLIRQATPGNRRLVAFIDDLERCRPPRPVELLEVVNQLLQHPNVVTVILADMPAVAACVEIKYKELAERYRPSGTGQPGQADAGQAYGRLYLQKIVQLQFDVPPPTPDRIRDLVDSRVKRRPPSPPPLPRWRRLATRLSRAARAAWEDLPLGRVLRARRVRELRREVFLRAQAPGGADPDEVMATLLAPEAVTPTLSNVVRETVQRALVGEESEVWKTAEAEARLHVPLLPRNAKRLVNRLRLLIYIAQARHMFAGDRELTARRIGKWAVLCERWPELAQVLAGETTLISRLEETARGNPLGSEVFTALMKQVAPVHAKDEALQPFCISEPQLQPILEDLLHLQPTPPAGPPAPLAAPAAAGAPSPEVAEPRASVGGPSSADTPSGALAS